MNGFEQRLARAWPRVQQPKLSGLAGLAIMTWPGPGLDYPSDGDMAARPSLHQTVLADVPKGWFTRAARRLIGADDAYNRACLEFVCGHTDEALGWLETALDREPARREWAQEDRDSDFIREAPEFGEIIGSAPKVADS